MARLRASFPLFLAAAFTLIVAAETYGLVNSQSANGKYDTDGDKLIEISYLEQLDAIRYDTDGDGWADEVGNTEQYDAAFPVTGSQLVCDEGCIGYELARSLDFDSSASYANGINEEWRTGSGWIPIYNFKATLDGHGNAISNLYRNNEGYEPGGLFYSIHGRSAVVKGIELVDVDVTGPYQLGALTGENGGKISHCYATGSVTSHSRDSSGTVGGLVGHNAGTINNSYAEVAVTDNGKGEYVGGLVGRNEDGGTISNSYATGSVTSNGDYVGGLVGYNVGTVSGSYATGSVKSTGNRIGGLVGYNAGTVSGSYAIGSVKSTGNRIGGLVGYNSHYEEEITANISDSYATGPVSGNGWVGGLVGQNGYSPGNGGAVAASYATGSVTGDSNVGGLIGYNYPGGSITDSYWNIEVTATGVGNGSGNGAMGQILGQLQEPTANMGIYANWNVLHWDFGTSSQYPVLKADFNGDGVATWEEFGNQRGQTPAPTPRSTAAPTPTPTEGIVDPNARPSAEVFGELLDAGLLVAVWRYDNATQSWDAYDPNVPAELNDLTHAAPKDIVWVEVTETTQFQGGTLRKGWSLISLK